MKANQLTTILPAPVAQIFDLLYRRLTVGRSRDDSGRWACSPAPQNEILRYGRLKVGVTGAALLALAAMLGLRTCAAQAFDCGSTGAYGPMNITTDTTLNLPPDGIFHCTTIAVAQGATLRFANNALNTPVYLLATGDVVINGAIDVSSPGASGYGASGYLGGKGGPGGFDGGNGGSYFMGQNIGGDGMGPGGAKNRSGWTYPTFGISSGYNTNTYGNALLRPLIGGSGGVGEDGSPGRGGGGGGGAVLIASNTRVTVGGTVSSSGGIGNYAAAGYGCGSGGAVRLVAPIVTGKGGVDVSTPVQGRIRVDCQDNIAYRSLSLAGVASRGNQMFVFPGAVAVPHLDIVEVAGQVIAEGTNNAVVIELSAGAFTNQTVRVQARNFTNDVPIRVVITPEHGPSGSFDATILQASGNPPFANVPVIIPAGSACQVHAWTR